MNVANFFVNSSYLTFLTVSLVEATVATMPPQLHPVLLLFVITSVLVPAHTEQLFDLFTNSESLSQETSETRLQKRELTVTGTCKQCVTKTSRIQ